MTPTRHVRTTFGGMADGVREQLRLQCRIVELLAEDDPRFAVLLDDMRTVVDRVAQAEHRWQRVMYALATDPAPPTPPPPSPGTRAA